MDLNQMVSAQVRLPSIPRVIALALGELQAREPDLRTIARHLKEDPVLTARVLALVNSARFSLGRGVTSVAEALPLLGLDELRDMLYAAALASAFRRVGGVDMVQFWRYSVNTAKLARKLARYTPHAAPAYTAGLLHAAGELVLHWLLPEKMAELDALVPVYDLQRAQVEQQRLGYSYAEVGAAFARTWHLPQALVTVLEHHVDPAGAAHPDPLTGIVHLAAWRARVHERNLGLEAMVASFPGAVAGMLEPEGREVLDAEVIDWASLGEVSGYL